MTVRDLRVLFEYGDWANRRLFAVIASLTPEQFTQTLTGSYGSIRNTLVHIMSAEAGWLERCGGPSRGPRPSPADFPTLESLINAWDRVAANVTGFLAELKEEDLLRDVEFSFEVSEKYSMPLGQLLHHAAIHGVHHRGQVALLLRLLDRAPGNFDILLYYADKSGVSIKW
jgi:uncharacterized damage-inducible protein DinB